MTAIQDSSSHKRHSAQSCLRVTTSLETVSIANYTRTRSFRKALELWHEFMRRWANVWRFLLFVQTVLLFRGEQCTRQGSSRIVGLRSDTGSQSSAAKIALLHYTEESAKPPSELYTIQKVYSSFIVPLGISVSSLYPSRKAQALTHDFW